MSNLATLRYLSQSDLLNLGANHSNSFIEAITEGLTLHANKQFVQPLKPYLRWQGADHIADRIIAMPCYLGATTRLPESNGLVQDNITLKNSIFRVPAH